MFWRNDEGLGKLKFSIENYDGFIFDLDGTIYLDDKIIPKSDSVINHLCSIGKQLVFISNKTTGTIKDYYNLLKKNRMNVRPEMFLNSTVVLTNFLKKNYLGSSFFAIGEDVFVDEIINAGLIFSNNPTEIDIVIVTLDRTFNYSKLEIAAKALDNGAKFYAANIDNTCPVEGGEIMDAGSTISALEKRTNRKLEKHFGKPSKEILDLALKKITFPRNRCVIIGDRLETDIAMGNMYSIDTIYVTSGVSPSNYDSDIYRPTFTLNSIAELI